MNEYLIPGQTGNRIMYMWHSILLLLSVINWPLREEDVFNDLIIYINKLICKWINRWIWIDKLIDGWQIILNLKDK